MLFSRKEIAEFINKNFEPVWESVRAVPVVRVDFGNGRVITRTLHGNIATYVCDNGGRVLDVLPGIYEPKAYIDRLSQLRLLAQYVEAPSPRGAGELLVDYHTRQARELAQGNAPAQLIAMPADISKLRIERNVKIILAPAPINITKHENSPTGEPRSTVSPEELSDWSSLTADTRVNESARRQQIHAYLASAGSVRPVHIKKWLYKEVLHADLDDPYLGLRPLLSAGYPFKDSNP